MVYLRPFSWIILGCLKKKKYLCGISNKQIIKIVWISFSLDARKSNSS